MGEQKSEKPDENLEEFLKGRGLGVNDIFNRIDLGVGIFDYINSKIIFLNDFINSIISSNREKILNEVWKNIKKCREGNIDKSEIPGIVEIEGELSQSYGFSNYFISDGIYIVFFNEITSKSIATKSQMDNFLYDKMSELIAEMSHEIGNPLAGISTMLELLLSRIGEFSREKFKDYLERTFEEINRLTKVLKKIRSVYVENRMEIESLDIRTLVNEIYEQNSDTFKRKNIVFKNNIVNDCIGNIDKDAFYQIIKNFFDNSLEVLKPGQWISISAEDIGDKYIRMVYMNNGESIPEESYERVFLPLYSTREEGSGLGLFISLKLMTRMGGTIKIVKPKDKRGVKFILFIPGRKNGAGKKSKQ